MAFSFHCPSCQATRSASGFLVGRRVRCPECDTLVEVPDPTIAKTGQQAERAGSSSAQKKVAQGDEKRTVALSPPDYQGGETVMLEAIDVIESVDVTEPVEVMEAIEPVEPPPPEGRDRRPRKTEQEEPPAPYQPKRKQAEIDMDMTPMVDVTFLLLIFFMVTAAFSLQKSIEVPKQKDEERSNVQEVDPQDNPDYVTVKVDQHNTFHVLTVDWEEEAPSEQDLHIKLHRARSGDSQGRIPSKLRVEAHGDSLHEKVVAALDAGSESKFEEVQLLTVEEDE